MSFLNHKKNFGLCVYEYDHMGLFLAHLSQRLIGELIVYPCSCVGRDCHQQFHTSPLKQLGQSKPNFMLRLIGMGEQKFIKIVQVA